MYAVFYQFMIHHIVLVWVFYAVICNSVWFMNQILWLFVFQFFSSCTRDNVISESVYVDKCTSHVTLWNIRYYSKDLGRLMFPCSPYSTPVLCNMPLFKHASFLLTLFLLCPCTCSYHYVSLMAIVWGHDFV